MLCDLRARFHKGQSPFPLSPPKPHSGPHHTIHMPPSATRPYHYLTAPDPHDPTLTPFKEARK